MPASVLCNSRADPPATHSGQAVCAGVPPSGVSIAGLLYPPPPSLWPHGSPFPPNPRGGRTQDSPAQRPTAGSPSPDAGGLRSTHGASAQDIGVWSQLSPSSRCVMLDDLFPHSGPQSPPLIDAEQRWGGESQATGADDPSSSQTPPGLQAQLGLGLLSWQPVPWQR